jgi:hypothetical protein
MNRMLFLLLIWLSFTNLFPQQTTPLKDIHQDLNKIVLMQATGEFVNGQPEMILMADSSDLYNTIMGNIESSFVSDFMDLYFLAQSYLYNIGEIDDIESAYLALTENQGGYAKKGFSLKTGEGNLNKENTPYVDITTSAATAELNKLMSFSQLYPHEMGHVLFHLLSPEDSTGSNTFSVDMHFFSLVTDYSTAFNEGFAEHIENLSRILEPNQKIKSGILNDIEKIERASVQAIKGFEMDYKNPFRLGYYKASMLNWYQKYEDYKRHVHALNGDIKYKNSSIQKYSIEDQLTYRNTGVKIDNEVFRNMVQLHSTEGVISSFFTHLSTSELANNYLDISFYKDFILDSTDLIQSPEMLFTPLQNQFIKYFYVLHNYVVVNNSSRSQLCDFIDGYLVSFPADSTEIYSIYEKTTGNKYTNILPPSIWLMVKNYNHRLLIFDPYGAITVPVYTFNLNAAETEDLQTIKSLSSLDAETIIAYRESIGYFSDLNQLKSVPGLTSSVSESIISSALITKEFEDILKDYNPELSIRALIIKPLLSILARASILFSFIFLIVYLLLIRKYNQTIKKTLILFVRYLLLWVVIVLLGLFMVFIGEQAFNYGLILSGILILTHLIIYRRRKEKLIRSLVLISLMCVLLLMSLI